jgi:hypothetical protein
VKLFTSKPAKIARESLTIDKESPPTSEGGHQEWRRFVGSIRRKVQRHASTSGGQDQPSSGQAAGESLSRKNSLTQNLFKKEDKKQPVTKQKSIGETTKADLFKALTFKDKSKSASVKHVDSLAAPKQADGQKGVRKSDKTKDSDRSLKSSLSKSKSSANKLKSKEEKGSVKQDDFLKATMRIFLVVSPPVGKLQVTLSSSTISVPKEPRFFLSPSLFGINFERVLTSFFQFLSGVCPTTETFCYQSGAKISVFVNLILSFINFTFCRKRLMMSK